MLAISEIVRQIKKKTQIPDGKTLTMVIMNLGTSIPSSYFIKPDQNIVDAIVDEHIILVAYKMKLCDNVYDLKNPKDFKKVYSNITISDKDIPSNIVVYYRLT